MPNPVYPGGIWIPGGAAAGYTRGHTTMVSAVAHYTVGRDSSGPAYLGNLFQFLLTRDGQVLQGAEADSVCWHAGHPYNQRGPGLEVEYLPGADDAVFTDVQRDATGQLCRWLEDEWGIPLEYHDDPADKRADWHGFISHRSVVSDADVHSDYWPQADWDAMVAVPAPALPLEDTMWLMLDTATLNNWLATANGMILVPNDQVLDLVAAGIKRYDVDTRTVQWLGQNLKP